MSQTRDVIETSSREDDVAAAVARLAAAARTRKPCAPVRDLIGVTDVDLAYQIQGRLVATRVARGATVSGRKIGLTSAAVQAQLGVDQPDFGVLLHDMDVSDLAVVPVGELLQPKIEAEIAFVLKEDLDKGALDAGRIRDAVDYAVAALEIVDSRVAGWDIRITDTVADNASSALYVLGPRRLQLDEFEPRDVRMSLFVDDVEVSRGEGSACLGDPLSALRWLAETARRFGEPLGAGQVVLSGALGPMVAVPSAGTVRAEISSLGAVSATFSPEAVR